MYKEYNDYELLYLIAEKDEFAYNKMHSKYNKLIKCIATKIYNNSKYYGFGLDDIYEVGLCGFYNAIDNFNEKEGVSFYTYAISVITKEMMTFIRNYNRDKHNILSDSISLNKKVIDDDKSIEDFIAINDDRIDNFYDIDVSKKMKDLKYELPFLHSLVYELRINNFNNKEITILLDIGYKKLDNIIRDIKDKLIKQIKLIEEN